MKWWPAKILGVHAEVGAEVVTYKDFLCINGWTNFILHAEEHIG